MPLKVLVLLLNLSVSSFKENTPKSTHFSLHANLQ